MRKKSTPACMKISITVRDQKSCQGNKPKKSVRRSFAPYWMHHKKCHTKKWVADRAMSAAKKGPLARKKQYLPQSSKEKHKAKVSDILNKCDILNTSIRYVL